MEGNGDVKIIDNVTVTQIDAGSRMIVEDVYLNENDPHMPDVYATLDVTPKNNNTVNLFKYDGE